MQLSSLTAYLDQRFPLSYQEGYDNSGLLVGDAAMPVQGILLSLDCTEAVLDEAISRQCNVVLCHHPIVFTGLKKITGKNYVERTLIKAIKYNIAIYAAHTNVDNMHKGVSARMAQKLGLVHCRVLAPKVGELQKLVCFAPVGAASAVLEALFAAGAGEIGQYSECSFTAIGKGTFSPGTSAQPKVGSAGGGREQVDEVKIEVILPKNLSNNILSALFSLDFYEEKAYELYNIDNAHPHVGSGIVGQLTNTVATKELLQLVAKTFCTPVIRHTAIEKQEVRTVAVCGGAGSFLLPQAKAAGADVLITADFKYHEFFDADGQIMIADIGHYESEQYTSEIFLEALQQKFPNFAVLLAEGNTNPINYFIP
jgi:dinuclear metal center YbgI/SA1388 family protein